MRTPRSPFPAPSVRSRIVRLTAFSIISEMRWTGTERRLRTPRCSSWWGVVGLPNSRTASVRAVLICGFLRTVMVHQVYPVHHLEAEAADRTRDRAENTSCEAEARPAGDRHAAHSIPRQEPPRRRRPIG